jgi:hypothetical protein
MRGWWFLVVLGLSCANDPTGNVPEADGATSRDASSEMDLSILDRAADRSAEPPDVSRERGVEPPDAGDAGFEPSIDVVIADGTMADVSREVDASSADASREADAMTDRCPVAMAHPSPWTSFAALDADAIDDVDAGDATGGVTDVTDGATDVTDGANASDGADARPSDARYEGDVFALCDAVQAKWRAFVMQNRDCAVTADCIVVGGAGACDCSPPWDPRLGHPIGMGSGDAINVSGQAAATMYLAQWDDLGCNLLQRYCVNDAGPPKNLRCEQGKCTLDLGGCGVPPPPEPCR